LTLTDPSEQVSPIEATEGVAENATTDTPVTSDVGAASRPRILIGSQRDPVAYRPRPKRDWTPIEEKGEGGGRKADGRKHRRGDRRGERGEGKKDERGARKEGVSVAPAPSSPTASADATMQVPPVQEMQVASESEVPRHESEISDSKSQISNLRSEIQAPSFPVPLPPSFPVPRPTSRTADLDVDAELDRAMGQVSMDELLGGGKAEEEPFEPESLQSGRVIAVRRDDVFVEFAGLQQGIISLRQFDVPPRPGAAIQAVVQRLNPEDGLYELSLPNKAVQVDDWSDLVEGALIEVRVTGHNTGGLECEVNHIRGFIPISQVALYRVEDLAPLVDQRLTCVITEADPERRNLVLSRRAVLEREREQAREQMLNSLRPGQICEGVVRKLLDFGAFVDLGGGVDGLVHVSQVAWARVKHPSDVLKEGQAIKVRIEKVDPATGKISLAYRDLLDSPWTTAAQKYPVNSVTSGTVTKLMGFGAFVELEPGVEGLVHISELSHRRVWRPADVVKEGDKVEVLVLSIDAEAQRISLSMKACAAPPEPVKKEETGEAAPAKTSKKKAKPTGPLLGGLSRPTGDRFGLKW
jgi:predicted RNA-binding protein with RPS1 domain